MVPLKAVASPAAAWTAFCVVWLVAAVFGVPSAFDGRTMTLPEAAAVASHADAARLLEAGADANARARVRAHLVRNDEKALTPLEAATAAIRTGPVQLLVDRGARIDDSNFAVLWCAAQARNNQDMVRFLRSRRASPAANVDCTRVASIW
jgi:ankyrin repeat protein